MLCEQYIAIFNIGISVVVAARTVTNYYKDGYSCFQFCLTVMLEIMSFR